LFNVKQDSVRGYCGIQCLVLTYASSGRHRAEHESLFPVTKAVQHVSILPFDISLVALFRHAASALAQNHVGMSLQGIKDAPVLNLSGNRSQGLEQSNEQRRLSRRSLSNLMKGDVDQSI
jgi:hypothetical protein